MPVEEGIVVCDPPEEVDAGKWLESHPDCNTVFEDTDVSSVIRVFAWSTGKEFNKKLKTFKDNSFPDKMILRGIAKVALA